VFINDGRIALNCTMDEVETSYVELMVKPANIDAARALSPLTEREMFGRHIFLYHQADRARLAELGELNTPSVADLFVATMSGGES